MLFISLLDINAKSFRKQVQLISNISCYRLYEGAFVIDVLIVSSIGVFQYL